MLNWHLRDDGVPIEIAASISGLNRGAFTMLRARGIFGPATSDPVPRASLLEVAAATGLTVCEMAGAVREHILPVLTQIADSAYVQLAIMEFGRRSWDPRAVPSSSIAQLAQKVHSDEGLIELQDRLGVRSRTTERFVIFASGEAIFANQPPQPNPAGRCDPSIDIWQIAHRIRNNVGGVLFHGVEAGSVLAA